MSKEQLLSAFHRFRDALFACDTEALDALLAQDFQSHHLRFPDVYVRGGRLLAGPLLPGHRSGMRPGRICTVCTNL